MSTLLVPFGSYKSIRVQTVVNKPEVEDSNSLLCKSEKGHGELSILNTAEMHRCPSTVARRCRAGARRYRHHNWSLRERRPSSRYEHAAPDLADLVPAGFFLFQ